MAVHLISRLMVQAAADGYKIAVLWSSPKGFSLYHNLGHQVYDGRVTYLMPRG